MKRLSKTVAAIFLMIAITGCASFSNKSKIANPNNVYRFAENTELKVLIQDKKSGSWSEADYKLIVPMGYYIGSGIEK